MFDKIADEYFRIHTIKHCNECMWFELEKPREEWDLNYLCHYAILKIYVKTHKKATIKSIVQYMRKIESDDKIMKFRRKMFKYLLKNMTEEDYIEFFKRMEDVINEKDVQ